MRVWTDGCDYVLARSVERVPALMDRHYGVTGHTLRGQWREVAADDLVCVIETESERVISVPARLVVNFPKEAWLGSVSRRKLARAISRM